MTPDDPSSPLPDGRYDAFVVDAGRRDGDLRLELTIVAGERKGDVVSLTAPGTAGEEWELVGLPATVTVTDGRPSVVIDR